MSYLTSEQVCELQQAASCAFSELFALPERPGIYVVHDFVQVFYIGQSFNLRRRWIRHERTKQILEIAPRLEQVRVSYFLRGYEKDKGRMSAERELIKRYKPTLNRRARTYRWQDVVMAPVPAYLMRHLKLHAELKGLEPDTMQAAILHRYLVEHDPDIPCKLFREQELDYGYVVSAIRSLDTTGIPDETPD